MVALALVAATLLLSLWVGVRTVDLETLWRVLWHPDGSEEAFIVSELRAPRAALALLLGAALGVAGALIQALTRNPLADTGILGVGAGSSFAVVLGIAFFGVTSLSQYLWLSFTGAIVVTVLVYALGSVGSLGATPVRLTLVGVALGALLGGFSSAITMLNPKAFDDLLRWSAGSLAGRGWETFGAVWIPIAVGLALALVAGRPLNAIALGDDAARALGAGVIRTRVLVIVAVTLLAGAAAAAAGPIGFVGLMVPHVVRWFIGAGPALDHPVLRARRGAPIARRGCRRPRDTRPEGARSWHRDRVPRRPRTHRAREAPERERTVSRTAPIRPAPRGVDFGYPSLTAQRARLSWHVSRRAVLVVVALLALTVAGILLSIATGTYTLSLSEVLAGLAGTGDPGTVLVVREWRLPRALLAALFGIALG